MARLCEDRVAIVTGGARGVGREHCLMLAEHGAKVVVNDLGGDRAGKGHDVGLADGFGEGELAPAHDHRRQAGQTAAVDPAMHPCAHPVEPRCGKSDLFGSNERQRIHGDPPR